MSYLFGLEYVERLPYMAQKGDRVFLPYAASALLSGFGSLKEHGSALGAGTTQGA